MNNGKNKQKTISNFQFLRFIASTIVVLAHIDVRFYYPNTPKLFNMGGLGVDIFLVISGFLMPYIAYGGYERIEQYKKKSHDFFIRRVIRIVPLYFLCTLLAVCFIWLISKGIIIPTADLVYQYPKNNLGVNNFIRSITFTHWGKAPIHSIGWTLQYEFVFYTLITLVIMFNISIKHFAVVYALVIFYLGDNPASGANLKLLTDPLMLDFLLGIILFLFAKHIRNKKIGVVSLFCILFFAILFANAFNVPNIARFLGRYTRPLTWGISAFLIVGISFYLEGRIRINKFFISLGNSSYSLYLVHWFLVVWSSYFFFKFKLAQYLPFYLYICLHLLVALLLGYCVHVFIELPLNTYFNRIYKKVQNIFNKHDSSINVAENNNVSKSM